jgi:hypothetical protein
MMVDLPCGIWHEGTLYDRVRVKEITGRQQNYLIDMELVAANLGHVPKLLEDLASEVMTKDGLALSIPAKDVIWKFSVEDVNVLLLKIREATYGPILALPTVCTHCENQEMKRVDLDKLEVTTLKDKKIQTCEVHLPKSNQKAVVKLLYLKDLFRLYEILREKTSTLYTGSLFLSLAQLGDKKDLTEADIMDLPITDLSLIEKAFDSLRGSVDTKIINECSKCGKEYSVDLPVMDPSFFVLSQTPST